jgi:hypothetical protein
VHLPLLYFTSILHTFHTHRYGLDLTENIVSCCVDPEWQPPLDSVVPPGLGGSDVSGSSSSSSSSSSSGTSSTTTTKITRRFDRSTVNDLPSTCAQLAYGIALEPHHGRALRAVSKSVLKWSSGFALPTEGEAAAMRAWAKAVRPVVKSIQLLYAQWPELQTPGW